jgi:hypothetical protein
MPAAAVLHLLLLLLVLSLLPVLALLSFNASCCWSWCRCPAVSCARSMHMESSTTRRCSYLKLSFLYRIALFGIEPLTLLVLQGDTLQLLRGQAAHTM